MANTLVLSILTPDREVYHGDVERITCHTEEGEITILPHHVPLLALLADGVITIKEPKEERYFSAGSGFIQTNGHEVRILISHGLGQEEVDEKTIEKVKEQAKELLKNYKNTADREDAIAMLRRASIDLKVLDKVKRRRR